MLRPLLIAIAPVVLLAGCSMGSDDGSADANALASGNSADLVPEEAGVLDQLIGGGKPVPLTTQFAHPGGMVVQLTSLQAKPTETVIGMTIINGDTDEQQLNAFPNNRNGFIVTGGGEKFFLSPPPTNPELRIQPGQRMEGQLVFLGRLPKGQNATLVLNETSSPANRYSNQPGFRLELPLTDAAFSDDGSKKN